MEYNNQQSSNKKIIQIFSPIHRDRHSLASKIIKRLTRSISKGSITFYYKSSAPIICDSGFDGPKAIIEIKSHKFIKRIVASGYLGIAESYINGEWSSPSRSTVFDFGAANLEELDRSITANSMVKFINFIVSLTNLNTKKGSRRNIANHYDLGNNFFSEWLDKSMTYSSGIHLNSNTTLEQAQESKYQRIVEKLNIKSSDKVLEIGCGWGGFAEYAGKKTGAKITAITISKEQLVYSAQRIKNSKLGDSVDIKLQDYRDVKGTFDKIVSIEMLEAVGESYWPTYFNTVSSLLGVQGSALVQVITVPDEYFDFYRSGTDFIQKYIFPGGMLICPNSIDILSKKAGLNLTDAYYFGQSYARTLEEWQERFQKAWNKLEELDFDDRFKRIWEYYLDYTSAGFKSGCTDVGQFHFNKS